MSVLEDLIVNTANSLPDELRGARNLPRNNRLTRDLKLALEDPDHPDAKDGSIAQVERLNEIAQLKDGERIVDVAVRGDAVTFQVADEDGVTSPGFFPLADLSSSGKRSARKAREKGAKADTTPQPTRSGSVPHGTASVPSDEHDGNPPPPEGVPGNIAELNRDDVIKLLKSPPEGVDPRAVARHERDVRETPRASVLKEAEKLGLFEAAPSA